MMKPTIVIGAIALMLGGCLSDREIIRSERLIVPEVPKQFLQCAGVRYPDPAHLTDAEVADLIIRLDDALHRCKENMGAVKEYLSRAKKRVARAEAERKAKEYTNGLR